MGKKVKDMSIQELFDFCDNRKSVCDGCPFNNLTCGVLRLRRYSKKFLDSEIKEVSIVWNT